MLLGDKNGINSVWSTSTLANIAELYLLNSDFTWLDCPPPDELCFLEKIPRSESREMCCVGGGGGDNNNNLPDKYKHKDLCPETFANPRLSSSHCSVSAVEPPDCPALPPDNKS